MTLKEALIRGEKGKTVPDRGGIAGLLEYPTQTGVGTLPRDRHRGRRTTLWPRVPLTGGSLGPQGEEVCRGWFMVRSIN